MISDPKGYYAVLDLQPNASPALIRAAYRVRAMELHPDRNDSLTSTPDFQRLQEAFDVLGDPLRRAAYDDLGSRAAAAEPLRPRPASQPPSPRPPRASATPAPPRPRHVRRFALPAGVATLVIGALAGWLYLGGDAARSTAARRTAPPSLAPAGPADPLQVLANIRPLPTSGILQLDLPSEAFAQPDRLPRLKLTAPSDSNYLVKISEWESNRPAMSVFVRAGDTTEVLVPVGRYRIRLASGAQWYGDTLRFGPTTQYSQVETMSEFQPIGDRLLQHELLLERFGGGDSASTRIPASSF